MLETYYKMLHPTETIQSALPAITDAFVLFYGEENREFIEQKFKDMLVIGYSSPQNVKSILMNMKKLKSTELMQEFADSIGIDFSSRKFKTYIETTSLENTYSIPIHLYSEFLKGSLPNYQVSRLVDFLKNFYPEVTTENVQELESQGRFIAMKEKAQKYDSIKDKYKSFLETIKEYDDYVVESENNLRNLENEYYWKFIEEFKEFISQEDLKKFEKAGGIVKNALYSAETLSTLVGWNLNSKSLIDSFDEESEEILRSDQQWKVDSVKGDRIKYFQKCGIDHGDNYDEYSNDPECKKLIPNLSFIKRVREKRESLYTELMNEYYLSTEDYKKNRRRIEEAGCLVEEDWFNANSYANNTTFISDNLVMQDGKYKLFPLLCINMGGCVEHLDANIIHELNHIIELALLEINGNVYSTTCGWDSSVSSIKKSEKSVVSLENRKEKRGYELFNEITNELIAQEIATILQNSGHTIFNAPGTGKIKGRTGYESTRYLIQDFFDEYRDDIIASRRNGNTIRIKQAVGENNFENLNTLFHEHNEKFQGFEIYRMYDDFEAKKDTPRTQAFHSLVSKRNEVLKSMQDYHTQLLVSQAIL